MVVLFTVWGYDVTALEFASVILALIAIGLGIRGTRWTWPFYFAASLLYGWLFIHVDLFASAAMQTIFMVAALWGWFAWGREGVRVPGRLTPSRRITGVVGAVVLWALLAPLLQRIGGVATYGDAFMLVGSMAGQLLMVRQKVEAWAVWGVVNLVGVLLYASQGLYFTSLFYGVLVAMAATGWRQWSARAAARDDESPTVAHA